MLYYLGKIGDQFKKEECKEYKTKDGALKAALKKEDSCVWDEDGNLIREAPEQQETPEQQEATEQQETPEQQEATEQQEAPEQQEATEQQEAPEQQKATEQQEALEQQEATEQLEEQTVEAEQKDKIIVPQGKMEVTVVCDGTLNIRRTPEWGNKNICGRAVRGQKYRVKEIHMVDGKKMVRTVGDLYLSGDSKFVQFEQI